MSVTETKSRSVPTLPSDQDASGRSFRPEHVELLRQVVESGTLTSTKGSFVKRLEQAFAEQLGVSHAYACTSGTAAIHIAVAAIDPEPGEEIVSSPITDMGAITPILYQGAIPVFADVDPRTLNVTAETVERCLSDKTRAILVTHLFGNPCKMDAILELAQRKNIPVIEDCAQAFLAQCDGRKVGTLGSIGCFSLQQGKHITTGEGGFVVTDDEALARRMFLYINKAWGYGDPSPDHYFLALNYRMTELQGALALAQLEGLEANVEGRRRMADRLTDKLAGLKGIETPWIEPGHHHSYWRYCLNVDDKKVPGGPTALGRALKQHDVASAPRYIQKPAFECQVLRDQCTFGKSRFPFTLARPEAVDYSRKHFPGTYEGLANVLVLPWNERYTEEHVDYLASSIKQAVKDLTGSDR